MTIAVTRVPRPDEMKSTDPDSYISKNMETDPHRKYVRDDSRASYTWKIEESGQWRA